MKRDHEDDCLIWQLADSAFPAGSFAHSGGLEAAWQHGEIRNAAELGAFLESSLRQLGHASLPFALAAHESPALLAALDEQCDAFITNHVANRASRLQGRAFLSSSAKIFPGRQINCPARGHFAPVFGSVARSLDLTASVTANLFFFQHLRGLIAAAVRLGIVGPLEGQRMQYRFIAAASEILEECRELPVAEATQTAPLLEIWQGTQDRLYSRLFQS